MAGNKPHSLLDEIDQAASYIPNAIDRGVHYVENPIINGVNAAKSYIQRNLPKPTIAQMQYNQRMQQLNAQYAKAHPVINGIEQFPAGVVRGVGNVLNGLGTAAYNPAGTVHNLAKDVASGATYAGDKALNMLGANPLSYATQRYLEDPGRTAGRALTSDFRDSNGNASLNATLNNLQTRPGEMAVNTAMLLAPAGDVAKGLSAIPRSAGRVAEGVANGARVGSNLKTAASNVGNTASDIASRIHGTGSKLSDIGANANPARLVSEPIKAVSSAVKPALQAFSNNSIYRASDATQPLRGDFSAIADSPVNPYDTLTVADGIMPRSERVAANPDLAAFVEANVNAKGLTPQAIAEGEAAYHGVPLTADQLNGTLSGIGTNAKLAGKDAQATIANSVASKSVPDADELHQLAAMDFINGHRSSSQNVNDLYSNLNTIDGAFDLDYFHEALGDQIRESLVGNPESGFQSLDAIRRSPNLNGANEVLKYLNREKAIAYFNRENGGVDPLTLGHINNMRVMINDLMKNTPSSDRNVLGRIKSSLDDVTQQQIQARKFTGDTDAAATAIQDASNAYKTHQMTYGPQGDLGGFARMLGNDKDAVLGEDAANPTPEVASRIGSAIADRVVKPNLSVTSPETLDKLTSINPALGDSVAQIARDRIFKGLSSGANGVDVLSAVNNFKDQFAPDELAHIVSGADIHHLLDQPLRRTVASTARPVVNGAKIVAKTLAGGAAGAVFGAPGAMIGSLAGEQYGNFQNRNGASTAAAINAVGAPTSLNLPGAIINKAQALGAKMDAAAPYAPAAITATQSKAPMTDAEALAKGYVPIDDNQPMTDAEALAKGYVPIDDSTPHADGGRIGFANGGAAGGIDHLVRRLMSKAKESKRAMQEETKPILRLHDNTVAKALEIANRSI